MFYRLLKWITEKCDSCFIQTGQFNTTSHFAIYYRNDTKPLDTRAVKYKNAEHPDLSRFGHKTKHKTSLPNPEGFFFSFKAAITLHICMASLPLPIQYPNSSWIRREAKAPREVLTSTWITTFPIKK